MKKKFIVVRGYQVINTAKRTHEAIILKDIKSTNRMGKSWSSWPMMRMAYWNALERLVKRGLVMNVHYPGKYIRVNGSRIHLKPGYYSVNLLQTPVTKTYTR